MPAPIFTAFSASATSDAVTLENDGQGYEQRRIMPYICGYIVRVKRELKRLTRVIYCSVCKVENLLSPRVGAFPPEPRWLLISLKPGYLAAGA
jgi:hypothetical protein